MSQRPLVNNFPPAIPALMWHFLSSLDLEPPIFSLGFGQKRPHLYRAGNAEAEPDRKRFNLVRSKKEVFKSC